MDIEAEIAQLRAMIVEVQKKYPPVKGAVAGELPWDIEFGFEKGVLRLFQIRPLVRYQEVAVLQQLSRLEGRGSASVRVKVAVAFDERLSFTPRELPAETRRRVVLWSLSGFAALCGLSAWLLLSAARSRRTPPHDPPYV